MSKPKPRDRRSFGDMIEAIEGKVADGGGEGKELDEAMDTDTGNGEGGSGRALMVGRGVSWSYSWLTSRRGSCCESDKSKTQFHFEENVAVG